MEYYMKQPRKGFCSACPDNGKKVWNTYALGALVHLLSFLPSLISAQSALDSLEYINPVVAREQILSIIKSEFEIGIKEQEEKISQLQKDFTVAETEQNLAEMARLQQEMGDVNYERQKNYRQPISNYLAALALYEKAGDNIGKAWVLLKLGHCYRLSLIEAPIVSYFREAEQLLAKSNDRAGYAFALYSLGVMTEPSLGVITTLPGERHVYFEQARTIQDSLLRIEPNNPLYLRNMSRYQNAFGNFEEALRLAKKAGDPTLQVIYLNNAGYGARLAGDFEKAMELYKKSMQICKEQKLLLMLRFTCDNLAFLHYVMGNYRMAFIYQTWKFNIMEYLWSEETTEELVRLRVGYETENQMLQNQILQADVKNKEQTIKQERRQLIFLLIIVVGLVSFLGYSLFSRRKIQQASATIARQNNHLQLKENQLREAQHIAKLANWRLDIPTGEVEYSSELLQIMGIPAATAFNEISHLVKNRVHPDDQNVYEKYISEITNKDMESGIEYRILRELGEIRWIVAKSKRVMNASEETIAVVGTIQDISDLKQAEKERLELAINQEFTAQLMEQQEEERKRIAEELHDSIGQEMLIIKNLASQGLKEHESENKKAISSSHLKEISVTASRLIDSIRHIIYDLRPVYLEEMGLSETLLISITKMCKASGIQLIEECENVDGFFKKNDEIHLYRVVQEIINNTIKHASASEVRFSIRKVENGVEIALSDNGVGLEQGSDRKNGEHASKMIGFGLNNIHHRVKRIGGEVLVESTPNTGTSYLIAFK